MKYTLRVIAVLITLFFISFTAPQNQKTIIIDAGHGGKDTGVTFDNNTEKDIVLSIAKKVEEYSNDNVKVILLRNGDDYISLNERVKKVNTINPDLLISLHLNNCEDTSKNGLEVYYSTNNSKAEKSKNIADKAIENFHGSYTNSNIRSADYYILQNSNCPAIIIELGFASNLNDRNYILSEKGQTEIAKAIIKMN